MKRDPNINFCTDQNLEVTTLKVLIKLAIEATYFMKCFMCNFILDSFVLKFKKKFKHFLDLNGD